MSFSLADFAAELVGFVPKLDYPLAETLVNDAFASIRQERLWSFLNTDGAVFTPAAMSTGTISVTQFATPGVVTGNAAASAAWLPLLLTPVPYTQMQFRLGGGSPIYNISLVDSTNVNAIALTLDRMYLEATQTASTYQIYRCYIKPPSTDFLRWQSVYDPTNGYWLRLHKTRQEVDRRDPLRSNQSQPIWVADYKPDSAGTPMFEMWPHPITAQGYITVYERKGLDLATTDTLPPILPDALLKAKAKMKACEWAIMNTGAHPELRGVDWRLIMTTSLTEYNQLLRMAKKQDAETYRNDKIIARGWLPQRRVAYDHNGNLTDPLVGR